MRLLTLFSILVLYSILSSCSTISREDQAKYTIDARKYSYYALDEKGKVIESADGMLLAKEQYYSFAREIDIPATAFVVMDPWIDNPSIFLTGC